MQRSFTTRRRAIRQLACGVMACAAPALARSASEMEAIGCLLPQGTISSISNELVLGAVSGRLIRTTGNRDMDRALGRALVRMSEIFGERPGFGFIDDGGSPNANASSDTQVPGTWGTVLYGQSLFRDLLDRNADKGMAVLAVAAHEFGHIAQFRSGVHTRLQAGQQTVKRIELHADFLSGYFLGLRKREDASISVWAAGKTFYEIGDYQYNDRNHHGTPDERVAAAEAGFKLGSQGRQYQEVFRQGVDFVLSRFV